MMRRFSIAVVGAGAVGSAIAHLCRRSGHSIRTVVSRRASPARALAASVRAKRWGIDVSSLDDASDVILLCVPDSEIPVVASAMRGASIGDAVVLHTSGLLSSDVLTPLKKRGRLVGSLHPLCSFPLSLTPSENAARMSGGIFGVEGSPPLRAWARTFVRALKCGMMSVPKERKTLYHAACTFASNYALTLLEVVRMLSERSGLPSGLQPFERLFLSSVEAGFREGPLRALTGPVARGDAKSLAEHARALRSYAPHAMPLFRELVLLTARQAFGEGRLTRSDVGRLNRVIRATKEGT